MNEVRIDGHQSPRHGARANLGRRAPAPFSVVMNSLGTGRPWSEFQIQQRKSTLQNTLLPPALIDRWEA